MDSPQVPHCPTQAKRGLESPADSRSGSFHNGTSGAPSLRFLLGREPSHLWVYGLMPRGLTECPTRLAFLTPAFAKNAMAGTLTLGATVYGTLYGTLKMITVLVPASIPAKVFPLIQVPWTKANVTPRALWSMVWSRLPEVS